MAQSWGRVATAQSAGRAGQVPVQGMQRQRRPQDARAIFQVAARFRVGSVSTVDGKHLAWIQFQMKTAPLIMIQLKMPVRRRGSEGQRGQG